MRLSSSPGFQFNSTERLTRFVSQRVRSADWIRAKYNNQSSAPLQIGSYGPYSPGFQFNGTLVDEVRIASVARSADWIRAEYNNQWSPASFYAVGAEQASGPGFTLSATPLSPLRWRRERPQHRQSQLTVSAGSVRQSPCPQRVGRLESQVFFRRVRPLAPRC